MNDSQSPIVVGLGELLWDVFPDSRRPGGAPANVAFQAGQLGAVGIVCSRVGHDPLGDELLAFLAAQGLTTEWIQRDPQHATGTVTVDLSQPSHPSFVIHENAAWDYLSAGPALVDLMGRAAAVCFGTLAQRTKPSRWAIYEALDATQSTCLIVYDVNLRQQWYSRESIEQSLRRAKLVKLNDAEALVLAELFGIPSRQPADLAHYFHDQFGVAACCVTRGADGCLLVCGDQQVDQPGLPVDVVDTVGAGDAFTAALIVATLRNWPLAARAAFANRVGGLVASRAGAMPLLGEEFGRLLEEYAGPISS
jgi:fructokinase